jgi:hypothetical protein
VKIVLNDERCSFFLKVCRIFTVGVAPKKKLL